MAISKPITRVEQYLAHISGMRVNVPEVPLTREEMYLAAWARKSGIEDTEMQGEPPLTLKDCIGEPFNGLVLYGKSTQVTTTGAQLLDIPDYTGISRGVTVTVKEGLISLHGTCTETGWILIERVTPVSLDGVYILSVYGADKRVTLATEKYSGIMASGSASTVNNSIAKRIAFSAKKGEVLNVDGIKVMLNAGDTALPWEPYTGGKPSPSPDYPQEIQSAGDDGNLSVIVKNPDNEQMQSVLFSTPNGLPGIPVSANGNYTDSNGQQWICDELDFERGVYRRRIKHANVVFYKTASSSTHGEYRHMAVDIKNLSREYTECLCNIATYSRDAANGKEGIRASGAYNALVLYYENLTNDNVPADVAYILSDPIETPLSEADIAAYRALTTYKGTTILESECYLKVKYSKLRK